MNWNEHRALPGSLKRVLLASLAVFALVAIAPNVANAQTPDDAPYSGDVAADGGVTLLVADKPGGVDIDDLVASLEDAGCDVWTIGITVEGDWATYVPGAPPFVNAAFPETLPEDMPFAVLCRDEEEESTEATAEDAVAVLEAYFADLDAGRYEDAYDAWREGRNVQTLEEFEAGYANTASVSVEVGEPGRIDAGAGQRYIEIPVVISSTLDDGTEQTFEGNYILHHTADIPGATPEQQLWHIYDAEIEQVD